MFNYADERTTNRRGVATKSYSRDSKAAFAEVIYAAFNHNPDDGDNDYDEGEDLPNQPTFNDVGMRVTLCLLTRITIRITPRYQPCR